MVDVKLIKDISIYDKEADVKSEEWNTAKAIKKLKETPKVKICHVLLDQQIFSGVGNIIKNEVLWRVKLHPETTIENITPTKLKNLMKEVVDYSFQFLEYKKQEHSPNTGKPITRKSAAVIKIK